jgi:tryptophan-rich sensory protein
LLLTFAAAGLGGFASAQAGGFYAELERPSWAPPGWLFGPVWTVLYCTMAISVWLVWREAERKGGALPYALYGVQLAANALWTWLFFVWKLGALAFFEVAILWLLIAATAAVFWQRKPWAAILLLPYLAWVGFATALTWSIWQRNPAVLG